METIEHSEHDDLLDLLRLEHAAIVSGRIEDLPEISERKTELAESLSPLDEFTADAKTIAAILDLAERNRLLLRETSSGLRSVVRRLTELRHLASGKDTYDSTGNRKEDSRDGGVLFKRT